MDILQTSTYTKKYDLNFAYLRKNHSKLHLLCCYASTPTCLKCFGGLRYSSPESM